MNVKVDVPIGCVIRVLEDDGDRDVVCVLDPGSGCTCNSCAFYPSNGECPFACCAVDRADGKEVVFVEVSGWKGGKK